MANHGNYTPEKVSFDSHGEHIAGCCTARTAMDHFRPS
ncbi:Uncharacterised protein [Mycolicibacterium fortuitum]|uniref:Uncharacterized protein n=1 Tax=Mycolicibacterium fortuitum TaxID=1766 RepID=A0A378U9D8_MYCFO|nr:Uncharacterised protein [Mycolicibacterium fortuitum]